MNPVLQGGTGMNPIRILIPIEPRTKKNHNTVYWNKKTNEFQGMGPSKPYDKYLKTCRTYLLGMSHRINEPVNVKAIYYMATRRKVDITGLHQALHDILKDCGVVADDNCKIIAATDGSRVRYDKEGPRTEIEITRLEE